MNYRHAYHAGNFADVYKHIVLIALIQHLTLKDKPLCYIDVHAGAGRYDLQGVEAQSTQEFEAGIVELYRLNANINSVLPSSIQQYFTIIQAEGFPRYYPGSPLIARACLRPQDRLLLTELHPEACQFLRAVFKGDTQTHIYCQDAYAALKALLPPKERRGLILIDPPYEKTDEWERILAGLKLGIQKFATGVYAVWYPITTNNQSAVDKFLKSVDQQHENVLISEYRKYPKNSPLGLIGCGMCIINPPWQLDRTLNLINHAQVLENKDVNP